MFNAYSSICARLAGDLASLSLSPSISHQHASKSRGVFCSEIVKSAVNLAIEEQVNQAVESRNASSPKTKHSSWTYGSFAKLRHVSVLEIRTAL